MNYFHMVESPFHTFSASISAYPRSFSPSITRAKPLLLIHSIHHEMLALTLGLSFNVPLEKTETKQCYFVTSAHSTITLYGGYVADVQTLDLLFTSDLSDLRAQISYLLNWYSTTPLFQEVVL